MKILKKKIAIATRVVLDDISYKVVSNSERRRVLENIYDVAWDMVGDVWHPIYINVGSYVFIGVTYETD